MGFKRPFNGDEIQGITFKQARGPSNDKLNRFSHPMSEDEVCYKNPVEICDIQQDEAIDSPQAHYISHNLEDSPSLHLFSTDSLSEISLENEFTMKRNIPSNEAYSFLLFNYSRKQVPIGVDYQAVLPPFPSEIETRSGPLVIPVPKDDSDELVPTARKPCSCPDTDSVRCVRQHIMEAREKLRVSVGHEKFVNLGFCEMGEEVACHWSEEEEQLFHRVVYSNPSSLGFNFWMHLAEAFPSRSTKEIISYYFNVFMFRRRASQNRSSLLGIDSDDDEWPGLNRRGSRVSKEEEHCGKEVSENYSDGTVEDSGSELLDPSECGAEKVDGGGKIAGEYSFQEDSCLSFEFPTDKSGDKSVSESGQVYLLEACETKMWDTPCSGSTKAVDLLPTCNIIEEIFGQGSCDISDRGII